MLHAKEMKTWKEPLALIEFYVEVLGKRRVRYITVASYEILDCRELAGLVGRHPGQSYRVTTRQYGKADTVESTDGQSFV